jgi:hypothetical protein
MRSVDKKVAKVGLSLIGLLGAAFLFTTFLPSYAHHLLLIVSTALISAGIQALSRYTAQSKWPERRAIIKTIKECEEEIALSQYSRIKYFYPVAEYEYLANGVTYLGRRVSLEKENVWVPEVNEWGDPTPMAERWWLSLKPGAEITVYINPKNEREAVLIRCINKNRRSHHLALVIGGLTLGSIWIFLVKYNLTMPSSGH